MSGDSANGLEGITDALLVPWDYDAGCSPVPWTRSARWLEGTDTVLLSVRRRGREHWAGDIPTFDVSPVPQAVYRGKWWEGRSFWTTREEIDSVSPVNTPEEYFEFLRRVPPHRLVRLGEESVLDSLQAWIVEHPEIGTREPARHVLAEVRQSVRSFWLFKQDIPFFGTWKLTIRLRSGAEHTQWMRTTRAGFWAWDNPALRRIPDHAGPDGFSFFFVTAPTLEDLPNYYPLPHPRWPIEVESHDPVRERHWRFGMQIGEFAHLKSVVPEIGELIAEWVALWEPRWEADQLEGLIGEIMMTSDTGAAMRIAWDTNGDAIADFTVTGQWVSRATADSGLRRDR